MNARRTNRTFWRCMPAAALVCVLWVGCNPLCFPPTKVDDLPIANLAIQAGNQAMDAGASLEDVIRAAVTAVENNAQVVAAAVDDDDPRNAWVMYSTGTEHFFEAIDLDEEILPTPTQPPRIAVDDALGGARVERGKGGSAAQVIPGLTPLWRMPANSNALLVNALTRCHVLQDVRPTVKAMLSARGYVVHDTVPLNIELFRNNNLMNYGAIFMETHGGIRTRNQRYNERAAARWNQIIGKNVPYCAGPGGANVIATDVLLDAEINRQYSDDLECGLLKYTTTFIRVGGRSVPCSVTYGVTPDFIRRYNTARFPDRTLVLMNACRTFKPQVESEWARLLSERCTGYHLLGWNDRVHYDTSATAFLNLLQLATGSDEKLTMVVPGLAQPVELLTQNVPPVAVSPVLNAALALSARGYDVDTTKGKRKGTGARFVFSMDLDPNGPIELVLAPDVRDFFIDQTGQTALMAVCQDHAELRIQHDQTQTGVTTLDIGSYGIYGIGGGWVHGVGLWSFPVPVGSRGVLTLAQDGRTGPPRDLLRWTPSFKITGTGPHQMSFTVTLLMQARALAGPRWRAGLVGPQIWNRPIDQFDARFDGGASVVTWSVSGGEDSPPGGTRYAYSGGGTKNLSFIDATGALYRASFTSMDGQSALVDVECSATLPYTETITDLGSGHTTVSEHLLPIAGLQLNSLMLDANWALQPGSQPLALGGNLSGNVSWSAASPTPLFNTDTMRR